MRSFKKINLAMLTALAMTTQLSATSLTLDVASSSDYSAALEVGTAHKIGEGALTFSNTDNAIGLLDIRAGTVNISASTNLNPTPAVQFSDGGGTLSITANIADSIACSLASNGAVSVGNGVAGQLGLLTGAYTLTKAGAGTLAIGSGIDNSASDSTIAVSAGILSVAAANNLPATTSLGSGTLELTDTLTTARAINLTAPSLVLVDNGKTATLGGDGLLTGAYRLTKTGAGTLVLNGDKSGATTAFTVLAGTLSISAAEQLPHGNETGALTLDGGTLAATADVIMPIAVALGGSSTLSTGAHAVTIGSGLSGNGTLTKSGSGSLILGGNNSAATTALTISAGTLSISAANQLPASGSPTLTLNDSTTLAATDAVVMPIAVALAGDATLSTGDHAVTIGHGLSGGHTLTKSGASALTVTSDISGVTGISVTTENGSLVAGGALSLPITTTLATGTTLTLGTDGAQNTEGVTSTVVVPGGATATLAGTAIGFAVSEGDASHTIVKTGNGTLVLTGDKTASNSAISVSSGGVLSVSAANQFPGGTATLNGGTLAISTDLTNTKPLTLNANSTLDIGSHIVTQTGALSGVHVLTKIGDGTLTMGAVAGCSSIFVSAGALSVSAANNLPVTTTLAFGRTLYTTANLTIADSKTLALGGDCSLDTAESTVAILAGTLSGTHTLTKSGTGVLLLEGDKSGSLSTIAVSTGTLRVSDADNFPAAVTVASGAVLETIGEVLTFDTRAVTFTSGSTLKLGGNWAKAITVS